VGTAHTHSLSRKIASYASYIIKVYRFQMHANENNGFFVTYPLMVHSEKSLMVSNNPTSDMKLRTETKLGPG